LLGERQCFDSALMLR